MLKDIVLDFVVSSCRNSPLALGYAGAHNTTVTGESCVPWYSVLGSPFTKIHPMTWHFDRPDKLGSTCLNPDDDINGPWCYVNADNLRMEYCDIPFCSCGKNEMMCDKGRCLTLEQKCDGIMDCDDETDEKDCKGLLFLFLFI